MIPPHFHLIKIIEAQIEEMEVERSRLKSIYDEQLEAARTDNENSRANLEAALRALNEMDALKVKREELESLLETQKSKLEDKILESKIRSTKLSMRHSI
ncbi:hypothetical protein L3Y34_013402 [Caenorhabditis briggsae]|uniref:Uncharacterized protein n=1 Tax=Caenorhabditis briggsae TaxID=6238 RepID=A0AAE9CWM5_CAEBR|nr:hypothetical protein L3Y34_013402 [Caenorhabditis briggsae]